MLPILGRVHTGPELTLVLICFVHVHTTVPLLTANIDPVEISRIRHGSILMTNDLNMVTQTNIIDLKSLQKYPNQ